MFMAVYKLLSGKTNRNKHLQQIVQNENNTKLRHCKVLNYIAMSQEVDVVAILHFLLLYLPT